MVVAQNAGAYMLGKTLSLLTIEAVSFALDSRSSFAGSSPLLFAHWKVLVVCLSGLAAEAFVAAPTDLLRAREAVDVAGSSIPAGLVNIVSAEARVSPFGIPGGVLAMWKGWRLCFLLKVGARIIDDGLSFILTRSLPLPLLRVAY